MSQGDISLSGFGSFSPPSGSTNSYSFVWPVRSYARLVPTLEDVIEAGEDVGMDERTQASASVDASQTSLSVGTRMWHEPVAHGIRHVVNDWHISKDVAFAQKYAMRLERIQAVRAEDHHAPAG